MIEEIVRRTTKPTYLIHKRSFGGLKENPTSAGPTWNIEFWYKTAA